jgi:hypothetical protein
VTGTECITTDQGRNPGRKEAKKYINAGNKEAKKQGIEKHCIKLLA